MMRQLSAVLSLPVTLAHESTHLIASYPWVVWWTLSVEPFGDGARLRVGWEDGLPWIVKAWCHLAPTVVGLLLGLVVTTWWFAEGMYLPATNLEWLVLLLAGSNWIIYSTPSRSDLWGWRE